MLVPAAAGPQYCSLWGRGTWSGGLWVGELAHCWGSEGSRGPGLLLFWGRGLGVCASGLHAFGLPLVGGLGVWWVWCLVVG